MPSLDIHFEFDEANPQDVEDSMFMIGRFIRQSIPLNVNEQSIDMELKEY